MKLLDEIFNLLVSFLEGCFGFLVEAIETLFGMGKRKHAYTADFTSGDSLLSRRNTGFRLTGIRSLSAKDSYTNALICGGTGVGKSSVVLIPTLYTTQASCIINDPSGELYEKCAAQMADRGYTVRILNFAKPEVSIGYNPLKRAQTSSQIQKIASMLVSGALGKGKEDPFWNNQAISLLSMLISILKTEPVQLQHLGNVRVLLSELGSNPKAVDALFARNAPPALFLEYKSFCSFDDKVVSGVIATCKAALSLFLDTAVVQTTSTNTLPFEEFRNKKVALFIQNSVADQRYYSTLVSLYFEEALAYILSRFPEKHESDIFLLLDECSSLKIPVLPLAFANVRKHRAGIMALIQDFNQLVHSYGKEDADAIAANCFAKMYFSGASAQTAEYLEKALGVFDYKDEKGNTVTRPLMKADEIRMLSTNKAIIICFNHPPIKARLRPYYKNRRLREFSQLKPPVQEGSTTPAATLVLASPSEIEEDDA